MKAEAIEVKDALIRSDLAACAAAMRRGWAAKKATSSSVSTAEIERVLDLALENGGIAGKVSGAGGGGFMLIMSDPFERQRTLDLLAKQPGRVLPCVFTNHGVQSWSSRF